MEVANLNGWEKAITGTLENVAPYVVESVATYYGTPELGKAAGGVTAGALKASHGKSRAPLIVAAKNPEATGAALEAERVLRLYWPYFAAGAVALLLLRR